MYETEDELSWMQRLLDASSERAGAHLRSIFDDGKRLSARQVSTYLQGVRQVAAAVVTSKGEPRVAPIDAVLFHGRFCLSTDSRSLRARRLARDPSISMTYFEEADPMIVVNGKVAFVRNDHPDFEAVDAEWTKAYGTSTLELSETVVFIRVEPARMLAYAMHPEKFPSPDTRARS